MEVFHLATITLEFFMIGRCSSIPETIPDELIGPIMDLRERFFLFIIALAALEGD